MDDVLAFLNSKTGVFSALAALISVIGGLLGIFRPWAKDRKDKAASAADLRMADVKAEAPPPWSEAGSIAFQLLNAGGGKAVMTGMRLIVLEHGASGNVKEPQPAAPVPQYTYKVKLKPEVREYDVRAKQFGPKPGPQSFDKGEIEAYLLELTSADPRWYRLRLEVDWYDAARPDSPATLHSPDLSLEFPRPPSA